jgi:phosphoglycerate kinase
MATDCIGEEVKAEISRMREGEVMLLENCRFHKGDEENDEAFSRALAELADLYVNDAFGTAHRAHASTEGITKYLPSVAGFLLEKEIQYLGQALRKSAKTIYSYIRWGEGAYGKKWRCPLCWRE